MSGMGVLLAHMFMFVTSEKAWWIVDYSQKPFLSLASSTNLTVHGFNYLSHKYTD